MTQPSNSRPVVMFSVPQLRHTTNPYVTQLFHELQSQVNVQTLNWRQLLWGSVDIFHIHWPEVLLRGSSWWKTLLRHLMVLWVIGRVRLGQITLVRTRHNDKPHESGSRRERFLMSLVERHAAGWILLHSYGQQPATGRYIVVPHGHYRNVVSPPVGNELVPNRVCTVGLIRAYKQVPTLISVFSELADPQYSLEVMGQAQPASLAHEVSQAASRDSRVILSLGFASDAEMRRCIEQSCVVALAYEEMNNSGVALLALSLDRPILVPDNAITRDLQTEVGHDWVYLYTNPLDAEKLAAAVKTAVTFLAHRPSSARPDLSDREWPVAAQRHADFYHRLLEERQGPLRSRGM